MRLPPQKSGSESSMARRMDVEAPGKVMTHEKAGGNDQEGTICKIKWAAGCKGEEDEDRGAGSESDLSLPAAVGNATEGGDGEGANICPAQRTLFGSLTARSVDCRPGAAGGRGDGGPAPSAAGGLPLAHRGRPPVHLRPVAAPRGPRERRPPRAGPGGQAGQAVEEGEEPQLG